jgi:hypothetical protein
MGPKRLGSRWLCSAVVVYSGVSERKQSELVQTTE